MAHSRHAEVKVIVLALLAIAVPFYATEIVGESKWRDLPVLCYLDRDYWYRSFAPGGAHRSWIDQIRIVSIARNTEPDAALGEVRCSHRDFMAALIGKIALADPQLIVLDKWYGLLHGGTCATETAKLRGAIQSASAKVPFVIAVGSYTRDEILGLCPDFSKHLEGEEMVLGEYEHFDEGAPPGRVNFGLARMNSDPRKIPLGWITFEGCELNPATKKMYPTIASAAALLLDKNVVQELDLEKLERNITHPYTKLAPRRTFTSISAIQLVCSGHDPKTDWKNIDWRSCKDEGDSTPPEDLRHKVVIIGETTADIHETDEGTITGPELQANYIAALMDEGILKPLPDWVHWVATGAWLLFLFSLFYFWKPRFPELAAITSALATFCLGVFFNAVVTRQFGVFADVVPPTILEIIGLYLGRRIELTLTHGKGA